MKRKVKCPHSEDISQCKPCFADFTTPYTPTPTDTDKELTELRNEISATLYGIYYYEMPDSWTDAKSIVERTAERSFEYFNALRVRDRLDELKRLNSKSMSNPQCQGCWSVAGYEADRIQQLEAESKEQL